MSEIQAQIWKGSTFRIERTQDNTTVIFRFSGPFTARDMYSALTPAALRKLFESDPPNPIPTDTIFDLSQVPYMDSCGLGLIVGHFVRCQNKGIRFSAAGITPRVLELFKTTKILGLFPFTASTGQA